MSRNRLVPFFAAAALALALTPTASHARLGGGSSFGSRGFRTYSAPAPTPFSSGASSINRSMTPNQSPTSRNSGYGSGYGSGGFFGRGFLGGLLGGGLLGLFFGRGFFGGGGGFGSLFGLLIQLGLVFFLARMAMRWFAGAQPGFAGFGGPSMFAPGGFASGSSASNASAGQPITLAGEDYNAFEWLLQESQTAFGAEDLDRIRQISTPEMASYFAEQVAQNARRGLVNKIADVHLLKGDLSEAWREPNGEFATVSMRFSLLDWTVDRQSGQVVEGDARTPQEVMEYWTFRRELGSGPRGWTVSAIQQANG